MGGIWDWFTDLGPGTWLVVGAVLAAGSLLLSFGMGRSDPSICDRTVEDAHDVRVYDGAQFLTAEGAFNLHSDSARFAERAAQTSGRQRAAFLALSRVTAGARRGRPFDASSALSSYGDACS